VFVNAGETSDEVVLERANGTFSSVASMAAGRDKLEINSLLHHEILKDRRGFVVEALEFGA
jgi:hypothetical protein